MSGFYSEQKRKAKCPLYESFVKTKNSKIAGIRCIGLDPGFDASIILKLHGFNQTMKHKRIYCDSLTEYHDCPYYKAFTKLHG